MGLEKNYSIKVLQKVKAPAKYISNLLKHNEELNESWKNIVKYLDFDDNKEKVACANIRGLLVIAQYLPSPTLKNKLKKWFSQFQYHF